MEKDQSDLAIEAMRYIRQEFVFCSAPLYDSTAFDYHLPTYASNAIKRHRKTVVSFLKEKGERSENFNI